jgi:hypothetical protein
MSRWADVISRPPWLVTIILAQLFTEVVIFIFNGTWLNTERGKVSNIQFFYTDESKFYVVLQDGRKYLMGENMPEKIDQAFMLEGIEDSTVIVAITNQ